MASRVFVIVDGKRIDITDVMAVREQACDRCGRYMTVWTTISTPPELVDGALNAVLVELCLECSRTLYPGLPDVAAKVLGRD